MDIYRKPATPKYVAACCWLQSLMTVNDLCRCDGLILLETFTTLSAEELLPRLPPFLNILRDVTGDPEYSMYNLSKKEDSHRTSREYARTPVPLASARCGGDAAAADQS